MSQSKKIFITGAAGFIGFHLARHLKKIGYEVVGYDRFDDYYDPQLKRERAKLLKEEGIEIFEGDVCNHVLLMGCLKNFKPTHLVHLAAQAGVRYSLENPQAYLHSNIEGFLSILEACRSFAGLALIYASSSSVYGLNAKIPFSTEDRTDQQASFYGVTKKTNELMAGTYHHLYGIPVTGLRFFTVYGPWGRPDMAYFTFTRNIFEKKPIKIYHQGEMWRDFTYITDIVDGIKVAIDRSFPCALFNLGNHRPEKLLYLVELLEKSIGAKAIKEFYPLQPGDVLSTAALIEDSQKELNFFPRVTLAQGIPEFVEWYKDYYQLN